MVANKLTPDEWDKFNNLDQPLTPITPQMINVRDKLAAAKDYYQNEIQKLSEGHITGNDGDDIFFSRIETLGEHFKEVTDVLERSNDENWTFSVTNTLTII